VQSQATVRAASEAELDVLAEHFREMWLEIGWHPETLRDDWYEVVATFIARARAENDFAGFVAETEGAVVGTAACQLGSALYPEIRRPSVHRAGYIWGVYVRPEYRRWGLARELTQAALGHLRQRGCTRVTLHASRAGDPVYRAMGFDGTNELGLALREGAAETGPPLDS
jgi:ribosomal protein S18 acetylase RimI-like enzyme